MKSTSHSFLALAATVCCVTSLIAASEPSAPKGLQSPTLVISAEVSSLVNNYCISCHNEKKQKGKVRLDTLTELSGVQRLDLLTRIQSEVHFEEMPPEEEKQPSAAERKLLSEWVRGEIIRFGGSDLIDKLRYPDYGNYVDHDKLFSGQIKDKPFSPARRWLVSPKIFEERVLDVFKLEGKDRENQKKQGFYGVTNPFVLPDKSGIRDYDNTALDGGHLLVMMTNVDWITTKQLHPVVQGKKGDPKPGELENPKDKWFPKSIPPAFEKIIAKESKPSDDELKDAIRAQFDCALQRKPGDKELEKYLQLARSAIDLGGNKEGLRQMLVSVLLESEFLYRVEFGSGNADEFGRKMLSAREASYAISYALGDRGPDAALVKAAAEGRLNSKADYKREVQRLLADTQYYLGQIDPMLNGSIQSHITSHPRLVRFFREFFGYPMALKVFKDPERSDGIYKNPDRGSAETPGFLIDEADQVVCGIVEADRDVFKSLLTTDQYIVYHNMDNEKGSQRIAGWKKVYDALKNSNWKTDPDQVVKDNEAMLKQYLDPKGVVGKSKVVHDASLSRFMLFFDQTFGRGCTPFTTTPWTFGNRYYHSPFYNLGKTPQRDAKPTTEEILNYQPVQPFSVPNRMGILTHPAWLIAHSQNSATDPVRRGRWIREKLLAGRVPDVPITVDAQIPEDSHKTLRQRLDSVTLKQECWKCHQQMNPLGLTFEMYDDFGRFRTNESLEHPENILVKAKTKEGTDTYKTLPVDAHGNLSGTSDSKLDGDVKNALELIDHLAKSTRVRQSIIRHAFRFFMGRNEMLSDSQTLIDADQSYVENGGSFKAVVVSLLTSDSFMYRK